MLSDDRWLSVDESAAYLGVKRDTIYKWIDRKGMPANKVGRLWKFKLNEVDSWVRRESHRGAREGLTLPPALKAQPRWPPTGNARNESNCCQRGKPHIDSLTGTSDNFGLF